MAFSIKYETVLTLRCWHPAYLGEAAGLVPVNGALTPRQERDYLTYDLRSQVDIRPTAIGLAYLKRRGLRWFATPQGGFLIGADDFVETDASQRLEIGFFPLSGSFAAQTDFGVNNLSGQYFRLTNETEPPAATLDLNDSVTRVLPFEARPPTADPTAFGILDLQAAGWGGTAFDLYFKENI